MITLHVVIVQDNKRKHSYQANFSVAITICIKFLGCFKDKHPPNVEALINKLTLLEKVVTSQETLKYNRLKASYIE